MSRLHQPRWGYWSGALLSTHSMLAADRGARFISGKLPPAERFGQESVLLLGGGILAILVIMAFTVLSLIQHRRCRDEINALEKALMEDDDG